MNVRVITIALLLATLPVGAQKKKTVVNDSNTPLHLLQPAYQGTYGDLSPEQVKKDIDRVFAYIDKETPARVVDKNTGKLITDYTTMGEEAQLERGAFRLASYEWGVTYSALIAAAEATGDQRYMDYVQNRFRFLAEVAPHFKRVYEEKGTTDPQLLQILTPHALDDAGAVCAAMVKVRVKDRSLPVDGLIENYFDFIQNKEYRLADGTFARNRPQHNTLWLDDMFMGIPAVAQMSRYDKAQKEIYLAEAVRQFLQFADRMFIPEKGLYRHGWVESSTDHPAFCWARANGWAMLTACELLDVLPEDYPQRAKVMDYFRAHVRGVTALQSGEGLWHNCSTGMILIWRRLLRLFTYTVWRMLSIKAGLMPLLMDLSLIWDGMPWPVRSMRKVRWKALVWVRGWLSILLFITIVRSMYMRHMDTDQCFGQVRK